MNEAKRCPECGQPLPPASASGGPNLCPACLLKRGLESDTIGVTAATANAARWQPLTVEKVAAYFPELEILELIGRGGMGAVYQARQKNLERTVALKILPPEIGRDPAFAQRFAHEAQALARLNHPHIVAIHDFGRRGTEEQGLYFFLMEFVDGLNLRQLLDTRQVTPAEALAIVPQICDALQFAHDRGIVHRDIKPENILLNRQGQVKIADFGLAKLMVRAVVDAGFSGADAGSAAVNDKVMGTPQYMAPEQAARPSEVDHRADIYSLGVVFYQMLTGELPAGKFAPPSRKVMIDVRLDESVLRALEAEPGRRYQQASELKTGIETVAQTGAFKPATHSAATPPPLSAPTGATQDAPAAALHAVRPPAIALIVTATLHLVVIVPLGLLAMTFASFVQVQMPETHMGSAPLFPGMKFAVFAGVTLFILLNGFICFAAARMLRLRGYAAGVIAALLSMLTFPLGLAAGIWALLVLGQTNVRDAFFHDPMRTDATPSGPPRLSIPAVIGAVWAGAGILAGVFILFSA